MWTRPEAGAAKGEPPPGHVGCCHFANNVTRWSIKTYKTYARRTSRRCGFQRYKSLLVVFSFPRRIIISLTRIGPTWANCTIPNPRPEQHHCLSVVNDKSNVPSARERERGGRARAFRLLVVFGTVRSGGQEVERVIFRSRNTLL